MNVDNVLPQLYDFYLVALHLSFTKAAETRRISQAAMSQQIKTLETKLQKQLFHRSSKSGVTLTREGQELFVLCKDIMPRVEQHLEHLLGQDESGPIRVGAAVVYGTRVLVPFLKRFQKSHPQIEVEVFFSDYLIDLPKDQVDIVLRWRDTSDTSLEYHHVMQDFLLPVASQDYLKSHPKITCPRDLSEHTVIERDAKGSDWEPWLNNLAKRNQPNFQKTIILDNTFAQIEAVKSDMGIALLPQYLIHGEMAQSQVKVVLPKTQYAAHKVYAAHVKTPYVPTKYKVFIDEFRAYLKTIFPQALTKIC